MSTNRFLRGLFPRSTRPMALTVEAGQVVCPARGVTDIEQCFACTAFRGSQTGDSDTIVCVPAVTPALAYVPAGFVPR